MNMLTKYCVRKMDIDGCCRPTAAGTCTHSFSKLRSFRPRAGPGLTRHVGPNSAQDVPKTPQDGVSKRSWNSMRFGGRLGLDLGPSWGPMLGHVGSIFGVFPALVLELASGAVLEVFWKPLGGRPGGKNQQKT